MCSSLSRKTRGMERWSFIKRRARSVDELHWFSHRFSENCSYSSMDTNNKNPAEILRARPTSSGSDRSRSLPIGRGRSSTDTSRSPWWSFDSARRCSTLAANLTIGTNDANASDHGDRWSTATMSKLNQWNCSIQLRSWWLNLKRKTKSNGDKKRNRKEEKHRKVRKTCSARNKSPTWSSLEQVETLSFFH